MKHIEKFNEFNESLLGGKLKKWFPESEERSTHNEIAKLIFNRIKDTFEYERLIRSQYINTYLYSLEETDSDLGFIEIQIKDIKEVFVPNYELLIDGNIINCSTSIKSDIFKFLKNKSQLKEENDKKSSAAIDLLNLKNKYNI